MTQEPKTDVKLEQGISNIVGALTDPIIVYPGGWGEDLPEWIKSNITLERLIMNMKALKGEEMTGTDSEACAYLFTTVLNFPVDHDWTQIYLYVANKVVKRWRGEATEIPKDIRVDMLTVDQERDLARLKAWIYQRRIAARKGHDAAERRQKREHIKREKERLQPKLFDF